MNRVPGSEPHQHGNVFRAFAPCLRVAASDLYHVIQMAAMAMFYIGAGRLRDRSNYEEVE